MYVSSLSHHTLPRRPSQSDRRTGTRPFLTVPHRPLDDSARRDFTVLVRIGVQLSEPEGPVAPGDTEVIASRGEFDAAARHLGPRAVVVAFAGVVLFAVGADPAVVGAFLDG